MNRSNYLCSKLAVVLGSSLLGFSAHGQPSVSVGITVPTPSVGIVIHADADFYEPLTPHGEWVTVGSYGRCWRPAHVEVGWRPYCHGNWQMTDDGWYWVSDEPWSWATYHYGRWDFNDQFGWYWVPQTQWAPAWVSWHEGGGYVGWAPLQPSVSISVNGYVGFNQSRVPQRAFVFVEQRRFLEPIRPATVVVNNTAIINKTTVNINSTRIVNNTVMNGGPATTAIEKSSGRKVAAVPVRGLRQKEEAVVAAKHPTTAPTVAKNGQSAQTPARSEVEPAARRAVAAPATSPVEKTVATPRALASIPQTGLVKESAKAQPISSQAKPVEVAPRPAAPQEPTAPRNAKVQHEKPTAAPASDESRPSVKPEARTEANHSAAVTEPAGQKATHAAKQEKPAREKPAASDKNETGPAEKNHENKVKDQF